MAIKGFQLDFGDGTTFRCSADVDVAHTGQAIFLLDGRNNFVSLFEDYINTGGGQPGRSDSNFSSVFAGFGAGVHTIRVTFRQVANTTDTWGGASSGSSTAVELRDRLVRALTTIRMDSGDVGLLQVGEFSDSGIYAEIPVAALNWELSVEVAGDGGKPSILRGTIEFGDSIDINDIVDALVR